MRRHLASSLTLLASVTLFAGCSMLPSDLPEHCKLLYNRCVDGCAERAPREWQVQPAPYEPDTDRSNQGDSDVPACTKECYDRAVACAPESFGDHAPPRRAATDDCGEAPCVWTARYFGDSGFSDVRLERGEAGIALEEPPVKGLPRIYSARWTLRAPPPGEWRFEIRTDGEVRTLLDGVALPLEQETAPTELRTQPFTLTETSRVEVELLNSGPSHSMALRLVPAK